jgi:hypothetical protein
MYTMSTSYHHDPAYRATEKPKDRSHLSLRKRLRRQAEARFKTPCAWHGGILYFVNERGEALSEVPNIQDVSKPGATAIGFSGAHPGKTSLGWSGRRWRSATANTSADYNYYRY